MNRARTLARVAFGTPTSASVGTAGTSGARLSFISASRRTWLPRICVSASV
jgi:hypothetical protein